MENGSVRPKNSKNILIKNLFDACNGALAFWLVGYGWAYGIKPGGFIGTDPKMFASSGFHEIEDSQEYMRWIF